MNTSPISLFLEVRILPLIAERLIWKVKPLNSIALTATSLFNSECLTHFLSQITDSRAAACVHDEFNTYNAKTIGLVGCVVYFRKSDICNRANSEISTEKGKVAPITKENFRKYLWLLMTGLVERSLCCVWPRLFELTKWPGEWNQSRKFS